MARDGNAIGKAAGFGIGVVWVLMGLWTRYNAYRGATHGRGDWALGWGLVGTLLLAAGSAALIGTWYHHYRILAREHDSH